jgi:hypothetical protein
MHESMDESPNFTNICIFRGENVYFWRNFNVICSVHTFFHIFSKLLPQSLKFRGWEFGIASMAFGEYTLYFGMKSFSQVRKITMSSSFKLSLPKFYVNSVQIWIFVIFHTFFNFFFRNLMHNM